MVALSYEIDAINIIPIVQMGKLRLSEGKEFTQGHTAAKWHNLNPGRLAPEPMVLTPGCIALRASKTGLWPSLGVGKGFLGEVSFCWESKMGSSLAGGKQAEGTVYEKGPGGTRLKCARDRSRDALMSCGFQGPTFWTHFLDLPITFSRSFTESVHSPCPAPSPSFWWKTPLHIRVTRDNQQPTGLAKKKDPHPITKRCLRTSRLDSLLPLFPPRYPFRWYNWQSNLHVRSKERWDSIYLIDFSASPAQGYSWLSLTHAIHLNTAYPCLPGIQGPFESGCFLSLKVINDFYPPGWSSCCW